MRELSEIQQRILNFIRVFRDENGFPPTRAEISRDIGCAPNNVQKHLARMEGKGAVKIKPKSPRGIKLVEV
ncbi:LexA repressor [Serratia sp. M24T3]|uniref:LexA family protein n=1 Tax=Serratia sp. M24T3 TaxID=932213 RepID=UPI00025B9151|nr:LexA repressor [Serratia sp. M24T3]EIC84017.1 LexA repressor [Serratia sp. M24T3]